MFGGLGGGLARLPAEGIAQQPSQHVAALLGQDALEQLVAQGYLVVADHVVEVFLVLGALGTDDARHHIARGLDVVLGQQCLQPALATVDDDATVVLERAAQAGLALGRDQKLVPLGLGLLRV